MLELKLSKKQFWFTAAIITSIYIYYFIDNSIYNVLIVKAKQLSPNVLNLGISSRQYQCNPYKSNYKPYSVTIDGIKYPKRTPLFLDESFDLECLNGGNETKRILLMTTYEGNYAWNGFGNGDQDVFIRNNCPVVNCQLTPNRLIFNQSDYVLFNWVDLSGLPINSSYRPANQRWIIAHYESPMYAGPSPNPNLFNSYFNMTSTYHINSDFPNLYSHTFYWKRNEMFDENVDVWATKTNKSRFAAATISNCGSNFERLKYIKLLKIHIDVDVYGGCTGIPCLNTYRQLNDSCKAMIGAEYKFYLSFENSVCTDYITEKFFDILKFNIVPVVHGGGPYDYYVNKYIVGFILLDFGEFEYFYSKKLTITVLKFRQF